MYGTLMVFQCFFSYCPSEVLTVLSAVHDHQRRIVGAEADLAVHELEQGVQRRAVPVVDDGLGLF